MTACVVSWNNDCYYSWDVPVMRCEDYNVAYLEPAPYCGRYCMGMCSGKYLDAIFMIYKRKPGKKSKSLTAKFIINCVGL